jgi:hypothetical protein
MIENCDDELVGRRVLGEIEGLPLELVFVSVFVNRADRREAALDGADIRLADGFAGCGRKSGLGRRASHSSWLSSMHPP